jgi:hypothetical protein
MDNRSGHAMANGESGRDRAVSHRRVGQDDFFMNIKPAVAAKNKEAEKWAIAGEGEPTSKNPRTTMDTIDIVGIKTFRRNIEEVV